MIGFLAFLALPTPSRLLDRKRVCSSSSCTHRPSPDNPQLLSPLALRLLRSVLSFPTHPSTLGGAGQL
eukprot:344162-Pyramimonas_sp.AAC.1